MATIGVMLFAAAGLAATSKSMPFGDGLTARLDASQDITIIATPKRGDAWTRLALRLTGDAERWRAIADLNGQGDNLQAGRKVRIPYAMVRPEIQRDAIRALFPGDGAVEGGWRHEVAAGGAIEGESLWKIAEWFTGDGANYAKIRAANPGQALSTHRGDRITIPNELLLAPFRGPARTKAAPKIAEDDPAEQKPSAEPASVTEIREPTAPIQLEYHREGDRPYAVYRLQQGEALYSSVGIRFTGRLYARDVNEVVDQVVAFNGIKDVSKIPTNYPVRIPMELLTTDWRPSDDPKRLAREQSSRESARLASRVKGSSSLEGVHVILDAGHGGRDVGTEHDDVWEATYVYDIASRVKKLIEARTGARVSMTTRSPSRGYKVLDRNKLEPVRDHVVLTSPNYRLDDPIIGVNLRWYLANSIFRRAIEKTTPEKVIFLSIHADSLHPSLRGAMAYVPGERLVRGSFTKDGRIYLARAEVRESPTVEHTAEEALLAEGLSTALARSIIGSFREAGLKVHPFNPVRDNVVRNGREWVPAIIRYNKVPTRLLLEVCNLGNPEDRRLMKTRSYRQDVAEAIHDGIVEFYGRQESEGGGMSMRTAAR